MEGFDNFLKRKAFEFINSNSLLHPSLSNSRLCVQVYKDLFGAMLGSFFWLASPAKELFGLVGDLLEGMLQTLPTNIRLSSEDLPRTNTLAC
jgi:hypothetical protein